VPAFEIDDDPARVDLDAVWAFLSTDAYWGRWRSKDDVAKQIAGAWRVVGAFVDGEQVGFARAITDYTVFAYLADVIVWPERRGHGIGKQLVQALLDNPEMTAVSHWSLTTSDAQSLYQKFGFRTEGRYMRLDRSPAA
jgi:GNAT superfamily N-acetyltransferase